MNYDISHLLRNWDYSNGHVVARRFKGRDGTQKIQLRVDLGILQMNSDGRPDGKRPMGFESWLEFFKNRWEKAKGVDGESEKFSLNSEDCSKLQQEAIQYHHRYICLYQLHDFDGVLRDCDRNLEAFAFADAFAANPDLAWSLNQFTPQLLMMRTRAAGSRALHDNRHPDALDAIQHGIESLEIFYREHGREEAIDASPELISLRNWLDDLRNSKSLPEPVPTPASKPLTDQERLQQQLDDAIRREDYERAAVVRDQLRKILPPQS